MSSSFKIILSTISLILSLIVSTAVVFAMILDSQLSLCAGISCIKATYLLLFLLGPITLVSYVCHLKYKKESLFWLSILSLGVIVVIGILKYL